jgi:hypothetical protein
LYLGDTVNFRLDPQYSNINFRSANGDSWYNALATQLRGRIFGQQFTFNYTWSHAIDTLSSTFSDEVVNNGLGFLDPFNPKLDRASADFDARHRISAQVLLDEPWFKNSNWLVRNLLGGYQFAPIVTFHTGYPFSIFDCTNSESSANCPRAQVAGPVPTSSSSYTPDLSSGQFSDVFNYITFPVMAGQYTGPATVPGTGTAMPCLDNGPGGSCITGSNLPTCSGLLHQGCSFPSNMLGRNIFRGPDNWDWTLGAYKNIKVTERVGLQLRAEFFDILNHKNFYVIGFPLGGADVSALTNGVGTTCFACSFSAQVQKGGYGNPFDDHRNTQLALRITF